MANNPSSYHSRPRPTVQQLVQNIQRSQIPPNPAPQAFPAPAYRGSESVPYTGQNKAPVVKGSEDITVTGYRDGMSDPRRRPKAPAPNQNQNPNQIRNPNQPSRSNRNIANQNQQNPSQGQGQQQGQSRRSGGRQQQNQRASHRGGQSSHDPGVGSSRGNGNGSGGRSRTEPKDKKDKENKGFLCSILGGIFSDGKGGPAPWRTDNRGGGLARRKGESNPRNYGFNIPERALDNPYWGDAPDLPPLSDKAKAKREKAKEKEREKKGKGRGSGKE